MTKALGCCMEYGSDPCALASRVTYVVADGKIEQVIDPFDAREGPKNLLSTL